MNWEIKDAIWWWSICAVTGAVFGGALFLPGCSIDPTVTVEKPIINISCVEVILEDGVHVKYCDDGGTDAEVP